jgi:hypothetical protein
MTKKRTRAYTHGVTPITRDDVTRFRRCAPAAMARQLSIGPSLSQSVEFAFMGAAPIVGMLYFNWSANELLLFLLVGTWMAILCDAVKVWGLGASVDKPAQDAYDDWHVWVIADALRKGQTTVPTSYIEAKYRPWKGVFIDFICGGFATGVICAAMAYTDAGFGLAGPLTSGWILSLLMLNVYQLLVTFWEVLRARMGAEPGRAAVASPGVRGVGLFLLMFIVVMVSESGNQTGSVARSIMLTVHGIFVGLAILNVISLLWGRREAQWLQNYLDAAE